MAGGTWTAQNKVRPGIYINFRSDASIGFTLGSRGTVAICEPLSWGPVGQVMEITPDADTTELLGYPMTDPAMRFLQQIFRGTNRTSGAARVLLYRPTATSSAQATAAMTPLTATAKYPGARGNSITVSVVQLPDQESQYQVSTIVDGLVMDQQTAAKVEDLVPNAWVTWSGTGNLAANAGTPLKGGEDGTVENAGYSAFLTAIEPYRFDVLIYDGSDATTLTAISGFVKRMCEDNGRYCQLVASFTTGPDSRYCIDVQSGAVLGDGTKLTKQQMCWWVGGAEAGAKANESLTYASHPDATAPDPVLTNAQVIQALTDGKLVLTSDYDTIHIEQDINSMTTYTPEIGQVYRKNRVIRLCNSIANDIYGQFSKNYLGVINNNEEGRSLFKAAIVGYMTTLQAQQAIQNFVADDVEVLAGDDIDSIVVNLAVQAVDSIEKIYMTVTVS